MRKTCLLFVLSIVSVFSISAQTEYQSIDNSVLLENVTENPGIEKIEFDKEINETPKINPSEEQIIPQSIEINFSNILPLTVGKKTLGSFSTGNREIDNHIEEFSAAYNIDPLLIYAQMSQESSFNQKAISVKGASGLMQLLPETARRFGVTNIYNPKQNIKAGVKYMRWLLDQFGGDMHLALAGYNAGEGAVKKYGNKIPPYRETKNYVSKIITRYEELSKQIPDQLK